ncbi:TIGR04211 family SH3 domain-containing protein [Hydrogenovibrio sp. 3SP14C1]|uniref:TIGR04211 family SH3 domain-containing protein n=1 Tax=Hydrogenovibrio sp. 3SP14C1 TaxID=3038774 RepID=UPI002415C3FD|nr:TIGR04211 family SH3 domain-containing protein [Hydrogenovibrio sp. 3SP14C1]MDG4812895.1 TIGR04211 family SH3 domain-containing protein [Hydrogenovibrio sp. 3SP14C1]
MKKLVKSNKTILSLMIAVSASAVTYSSTALSEVQSGYTHYVTDSIEIPFRSQPGYKYKILRMLKSGTKVTILEVNDDGWARLIYNYKGDDIEGWMPSSVLQSQPIAKVEVQKQDRKIAKIEKELNQLNLEKNTLQSRFNDTAKELKEVKQDNFELNKQLEEIKAISGNAIQLNNENKQMVQQIEKLNNENAIMKEQIDQAKDVVQRQWFLTGGGVLLLGLLLGRFFRIPNRKNKWNTL